MGVNIRLYEHNDVRGQPGGVNVTPSMTFSGSTRTPPGFVTPAVHQHQGRHQQHGQYPAAQRDQRAGRIPAQLSQIFLGDMNSDTFLPFKTGNAVTMWAEGHRLKQFNFYFQDEWKLRQNSP